ncbi:hypothetical protein DL96DRAFT_1705580 [Flagelloscypha sp. PMI_526]|nr:hypothetical protein DL96DRAFT_1705580 [Flagelloscypha sp. PMI_526]
MSSTTTQTQTAIITAKPGAGFTLVSDHPAESGKMIPEGAYPYVLGKAFAGEVTTVGEKVVVGVGYVPGQGSLQSYLTTSALNASLLPSSISYIDAATIPHNYAASFNALFSKTSGLGLPLPPTTENDKNEPILVWGASSSTGSCAIQTLSGLGYTSLVAVASSSALQDLNALEGVVGAYDRTLPEDKLIESIGKKFKYVYVALCDQEAWGAGSEVGRWRRREEQMKIVEGKKVSFKRSIAFSIYEDPAIFETIFAVHLQGFLESGKFKMWKKPRVFDESAGSLEERAKKAFEEVENVGGGGPVVMTV